MKKYLYIVLIFNFYVFENIIAQNVAETNKGPDSNNQKIETLKIEAISSFKSFHHSGAKNALIYNLFSFRFIVPLLINIYEPLVLGNPIYMYILNKLVWNNFIDLHLKLKSLNESEDFNAVISEIDEDPNFWQDALDSANVDDLKSKYNKGFIYSNLIINVGGYIFVDWITGLTFP